MYCGRICQIRAMTLIKCCCWNNPGGVPTSSISTWMSSVLRRSLCHHQWWPTHRPLGRPVTSPQGWKEAFVRSTLLVQWLSNMCPLVKAAALLAAVGVAREGGVSHVFLPQLSCVAACCVLHGSPSAVGETCLLLKEPCSLMPSVRSSPSLNCDKPQKKNAGN